MGCCQLHNGGFSLRRSLLLIAVTTSLALGRDDELFRIPTDSYTKRSISDRTGITRSAFAHKHQTNRKPIVSSYHGTRQYTRLTQPLISRPVGNIIRDAHVPPTPQNVNYSRRY